MIHILRKIANIQIGPELKTETYQYVKLFNIHNNCDNNLFVVKK
jgi:hypothetical protein